MDSVTSVPLGAHQTGGAPTRVDWALEKVLADPQATPARWPCIIFSRCDIDGYRAVWHGQKWDV